MSTPKRRQQTSSQQPEQKKSYLDIINEQLSKTESHDQFSEKVKRLQGIDSYKIYEDLKIISEVAKDEGDGLGPKFWKEFEERKQLNRAHHSMKDRYHQYLQYLNQHDFDSILNYIGSNNLYGYLVFAKSAQGSQKVLEKIVDEQEFLKKMQSKNVGKDQNLSKNMFVEQININTNKLSQSFLKLSPMYDEMSDYEDVEIEVLHGKRVVKKVKQEQNQVQKKSKGTAKDHSQLIKNLSSSLNLTIKELLERIEKASGSIQDIILSIDTKNPKLLWSKDDDKNLSKCKDKKDREFKILLKEKGIDRIKERLNFKKIKLNFAL